VLDPDEKTFQRLLELNQIVGSAEGGDQGVLNNGFCPQWNSVGADDPACGRLPWMFNVQAAHYETYKTLRKMSGLREPTLIHFVSDGKPWRVMAMDYQNMPFSPDNVAKLTAQREAHLLWREAFFAGTVEEGIAPPASTVLFPDSYKQQKKEGVVNAASNEFDFNFEAEEEVKRPVKKASATGKKRRRTSEKSERSERSESSSSKQKTRRSRKGSRQDE
jgi:lipopolysaccharide biosynthesis glycosyltransferase